MAIGSNGVPKTVAPQTPRGGLTGATVRGKGATPSRGGVMDLPGRSKNAGQTKTKKR